MIRKIPYCDRHNGEHPAVTSVWIRTPGMSRVVKLDVCEGAFRTIMGTDNGTPMLPAPASKPESYRGMGTRKRGIGAMPGSDTAKLANTINAFVKGMHRRFTLDEVHSAVESLPLKHTPKGNIRARCGPVIRALLEDGVIERHGVFGVFGPKGLPKNPQPANPAERATLIAKTIRAHPGVRVAFLPGLLDVEAPAIKRTVAQLVQMGLVKTKGARSSSRAWALEQKGKN
jgi:hypothetical protein